MEEILQRNWKLRWIKATKRHRRTTKPVYISKHLKKKKKKEKLEHHFLFGQTPTRSTLITACPYKCITILNRLCREMNLYKLDDQLTGTMSNVHSVLDYVFSVQNLKCEEGNLSDENGPQMPDCEQSDLYSLLHLTGKYFKHSSLHQQDFIFPWQSAKVHQTWSPPRPPTRSWLESLATTSPCTKLFVYETCSPRTTSLPLRTPARSTTIGLPWNLPFADSTLKIARLFFLAYLCVFLLGNPQSRKACIKKTHREQQQHKQAYASRSNSTASIRHVEFSSKTARSKPSKWERDEETGKINQIVSVYHPGWPISGHIILSCVGVCQWRHPDQTLVPTCEFSQIKACFCVQSPPKRKQWFCFAFCRSSPNAHLGKVKSLRWTTASCVGAGT